MTTRVYFPPFILTSVLILTRFYCNRNILWGWRRIKQSDLPQLLPPPQSPQSVNLPFSMAGSALLPPPTPNHYHHTTIVYWVRTMCPVLSYASVACIIVSVLETVNCQADTKMGLKVQGFYWGKYPCERKWGGSQRRLGEPYEPKWRREGEKVGCKCPRLPAV